VGEKFFRVRVSCICRILRKEEGGRRDERKEGKLKA